MLAPQNHYNYFLQIPKKILYKRPGKAGDFVHDHEKNSKFAEKFFPRFGTDATPLRRLRMQ